MWLPKEKAPGIPLKIAKVFLAEFNLPSEFIFASFHEENYNLYRRLLNP
jgi:hypothetical protein